MRYIYFFMVALGVSGCFFMIKKGDYVRYSSNDYVFIDNSFIDKKIDCIELGEIKGGGLGVKYCMGTNYASQVVQGFIFEHKYKSVSQRLIGATLSFQGKQMITIPCSSETVEGETSGKEYVNCMIPQKAFDLHAFLMHSKLETQGVFRAAVGDGRLYDGVIDTEGKALLDKFYQDRLTQGKQEWKHTRL